MIGSVLACMLRGRLSGVLSGVSFVFFRSFAGYLFVFLFCAGCAGGQREERVTDRSEHYTSPMAGVG